jgi:hypothetical protein
MFLYSPSIACNYSVRKNVGSDKQEIAVASYKRSGSLAYQKEMEGNVSAAERGNLASSLPYNEWDLVPWLQYS